MRGIQLLCGVVAESLRSGSSRKRLESFIKGANCIAGTPDEREAALYIESAVNSPPRRRNKRPAARRATPLTPGAPGDLDMPHAEVLDCFSDSPDQEDAAPPRHDFSYEYGEDTPHSVSTGAASESLSQRGTGATVATVSSGGSSKEVEIMGVGESDNGGMYSSDSTVEVPPPRRHF